MRGATGRRGLAVGLVVVAQEAMAGQAEEETSVDCRRQDRRSNSRPQVHRSVTRPWESHDEEEDVGIGEPFAA